MLRITAALLALCAGLPGQERLTAVYTLDHEQRRFPADAVLETEVAGWAAQCSIVPGGAVFELRCPPSPPPIEGDRGPLAALALLRDLDENVFLAGCPARDALRKNDERRAQGADAEADPAFVQILEDCAAIRTGRTFSAAAEPERLRLVVRGRRLEMTIYKSQPREVSLGSPYIPKPTRGSLGHAGPPTVTGGMPDPSPEEAPWSPPNEPAAQAEPRAAKPALRAPPPARTDLATGRLRVTCREGEVWIDGAWMGRCPIDMPIAAGEHRVEIRRAGRSESCTAEVESGKTVELSGCR